jgi:hypothetical protein
MRKRLVAVAAAVAAVLVVAGGAPAGAQSYPPPPASLTVDNRAPAPGQAITVTMTGCRPDTFALFGVDQILLGSGRAGSDGVARATITIPATLPAGPHTVSGFCVGANGLPLFLRTTIDVTLSAPPPSGTPPPPGGTSTGTGTGSRAGGGRGGGTTRAASVPSADELAAPTLPADAPVLFGDAAEANGVPRTPRTSAPEGAEPAATTADHAGSADIGPFSTMARVGLGLAAIFGVPVALAVSRRPRRAAPRPA